MFYFLILDNNTVIYNGTGNFTTITSNTLHLFSNRANVGQYNFTNNLVLQIWFVCQTGDTTGQNVKFYFRDNTVPSLETILPSGRLGPTGATGPAGPPGPPVNLPISVQNSFLSYINGQWTGAGQNSVSIGQQTSQNYTNDGISIGLASGESDKGQGSISIGRESARYSQGMFSIAIGRSTAMNNQRNDAIAIGTNAGSVS
jgi:hypothetical protein